MSGSLSDPERLRALAATALLDSAPEDAFDRYTRLASRLLDAPVSLVSLVDADRQFFLSGGARSARRRCRTRSAVTWWICAHR